MRRRFLLYPIYADRTYIDVEGRPEAFFALTVSFHKSYCTNVYRLFQLFEAVYSQICVGSILQQSENIERFLVADFYGSPFGS